MSLVDVLGSAAILTTGVSTTGVSLDINVSYLTSAYADVRNIYLNRIIPFVLLVFLDFLLRQ